MTNIAAAFIKAKKEFAPAMKTSTNPHYKSKYADLAACVEAVDDAFLNSGIVMYQETFEDTAGVTVETVLLHESGESIRCGKLHVPAPKQDPQGYGSALSYARRYSLMAACGIAPEDDDGNRASERREDASGMREHAVKLSNEAGLQTGDAPAPRFPFNMNGQKGKPLSECHLQTLKGALSWIDSKQDLREKFAEVALDIAAELTRREQTTLATEE